MEPTDQYWFPIPFYVSESENSNQRQVKKNDREFYPNYINYVHINFHRDKLNADDYIATCFINIDEVSASGEHGM